MRKSDLKEMKMKHFSTKYIYCYFRKNSYPKDVFSKCFKHHLLKYDDSQNFVRNVHLFKTYSLPHSVVSSM